MIEIIEHGHGQAAQKTVVLLAAEDGIISVALLVMQPRSHPQTGAANRAALFSDIAVIQNGS